VAHGRVAKMVFALHLRLHVLSLARPQSTVLPVVPGIAVVLDFVSTRAFALRAASALDNASTSRRVARDARVSVVDVSIHQAHVLALVRAAPAVQSRLVVAGQRVSMEHVRPQVAEAVHRAVQTVQRVQRAHAEQKHDVFQVGVSIQMSASLHVRPVCNAVLVVGLNARVSVVNANNLLVVQHLAGWMRSAMSLGVGPKSNVLVDAVPIRASARLLVRVTRTVSPMSVGPEKPASMGPVRCRPALPLV